MRLRHRKLTPSSERLNFTFDGIRVEALAGETIAAALTAAGRPALRDAGAELGSSDDMRGLYCGMGACFDCVVTVDGRAGQRACLTKVAGGETVRSSAPSGTPDDPLRPLAASPKRAELPEEAMDVLVVGAGPAGLAAGVVAARAGAKVVLLDERAQSGGQYFKPLAPSQQAVRPIDAQFAAGARLERDAAVAGVDIRQGVQVWGAQAPDEVLALVDGEARVMRPRRLILATGAYERPYPMPGWTLPGVMTTGAAQTLVRAYGVAPGRRVVVAGNGPLNLQLAEELLARGVKVAAIVESAAKPSPRRVAHVMKATAAAPDLMAQGLATLARLRRAGIPTYWGHVAVAALGAGQVEALRIAPVGADGTPDLDAARDIAADAACLGYGFIASSEIARALGCDMRHDRRHLGSLAVATDEDGATSVKGVYAIGDGASVSGARVALARGTLAGAACARDLGFDAPEGQGTRRALARAERFQAALWSLYAAPPATLRHVPDETMLCRCEGLTCGRLRAEIAAGWDGLPTLKRRTRLGMGRCQGRYCVPSASLLLAEMTGQERHDEEGFAPRLPVKPFPAAALAVEKPEWGGHARAGSPNLARPRRVDDVVAREAEIVVIGGGVVGACLAFELAEAGRDVLVVERDDVNLQASGANAGSLHVQLLSFDFGAKAEAGGGPAAATLPLGPYAVRLWQELAERCREDGLGGFEIRITGGLMVAETDKGLDFLRAKAALERQHGVEAEVLSAAELRKLAPNLNPALIGAEYAPQEGKINPLAATYAVFEAARRRGARYLRGADVTAIARTCGRMDGADLARRDPRADRRQRRRTVGTADRRHGGAGRARLQRALSR